MRQVRNMHFLFYVFLIKYMKSVLNLEYTKNTRGFTAVGWNMGRNAFLQRWAQVAKRLLFSEF